MTKKFFKCPDCNVDCKDDSFGFNPPLPECPKCGRTFGPEYWSGEKVEERLLVNLDATDIYAVGQCIASRMKELTNKLNCSAITLNDSRTDIKEMQIVLRFTKTFNILCYHHTKKRYEEKLK